MNRNAQQSAKILADDFPGWSLDEILKRLDGPEKEAGFEDPRNCLVIWGRPSSAVKDVIAFVQQELRAVAPCMSLFAPRPSLSIFPLDLSGTFQEKGD